MTKLKLAAAALLSAAMLAGCAHPDFVKMDTHYDTVVEQLGAPSAVQVRADGTVRALYSQQPMGQEVYELIFDKGGKLVSKENILKEAYFDRIEPKTMRSADILAMYGEPCEKWTYKNLGEHTFMYRYQDQAGFPMALWVDFDLETDEVLRHVISIDPWSQRDGEWEAN